MINSNNSILFWVFVIFCNSCISGSTSNDNVSQNNVLQIDNVEKHVCFVDSTSFSGLRLYYPSISAIGFQVGEEPDTAVSSICFSCAASYTGRTIYGHPTSPLHIDVAGNHVEEGVLYQGYECPNNTGGFVWYPYPDSSWKIVDRNEYLNRLSQDSLPGISFQQELLIHDGEIQQFVRKDRATLYRALCNLDGQLCIIDGTREHMLVSFVDLLKNIGVSDALYLDMGDWSYSWYRDYPEDVEGSKVTIIQEKPDGRPYYGSNWLIFYYVN